MTPFKFFSFNHYQDTVTIIFHSIQPLMLIKRELEILLPLVIKEKGI